MAAVDYFLKLDGIQGESKDAKHTNEIQLDSYSFGASNTGSFANIGGGGAGKVAMQDFHFVKRIDKAGPTLFQSCCTGKHIASALLTCRKAGGDQQEYLKITLKDVLVSSYQISGQGGSDIIPTEQISLNFASIDVKYQEQKPDGTLGGTTPAAFNLKTMKAG